MKCLYDIFGSHRDLFDDLLVLPAAQYLIIYYTQFLYLSLNCVIYRIKPVRS
jgi:hypothetical protein